MAEIQEYNQQAEATGAVGGTSPNLELAGSVGRAVAGLGATIEEGGQYIHRRQAQEETADVYQNFADQRAVWTDRVHQQIQDGTLNVDQLKDDFDQQTGGMGDNYSTAEGKNYYTRQLARTRGHIIQMAQSGAAVVASNKAKASLVTAIDANSAVLDRQPDQDTYKDIYDQGLEHIDQLIKTGGLPEAMRDKAVQEMGQKYSTAYLLGKAKINPQAAKQDLSNPMFDSFFSPEQRHAIGSEIDATARAKDTDIAREEMNKERLQKAQFNTIMNGDGKGGSGWYKRIQEGSLSAQEILKTPGIGWEQKQLAQQMVQRATDEKFRPNPAAYNEAFLRIHDDTRDDKITDDQQLMQSYPNLPANELEHLSAGIARTPEGALRAAKEKELHSEAQTLLFKDNFNGTTAPESKVLVQRFLLDYQNEKAKYLKAGKDPDELLDRNSPNWWGYKTGAYTVQPQDQMNYLANVRKNKALGLDENGKQVPTASQSAPPPPPNPTDAIQQTPAGQPSDLNGNQPLPTAAAPAAPQKELNWWEPHPNDSPEIAQNRATNAAARQQVLDGISALKDSPITKGIMESLRGTKEITGALSKGKPSDMKKTLGERAMKPGESIEQYNSRLGINVGPMGPIK